MSSLAVCKISAI